MGGHEFDGVGAVASNEPIAVVVVQWWKNGKAGRPGRQGKKHLSHDGIMTVCGFLVPDHARRTTPTTEWYLYTTCYNCAYRLWPQHGPADYLCPANGSDFPIRKKCEHGRHPRGCPRCHPSAAQNWPCPNGCTDPVDHDPVSRYTKCTVRPPVKQFSPDVERCPDGCESTDLVMHRANPGLRFDLADSASMICYHCCAPVCINCQTAPVNDVLQLCPPCGQRSAADWDLAEGFTDDWEFDD